jgi:hypothetical protein
MRIILLLICSLWWQPAPTVIDFKKEFGRDYLWAENWIREHDGQVEKYAQLFGVPSKELKAIVFPELIRYNLVFDVIQIESLKYLYVSEGKYYADFSVGYFQMKPSFAEMVEEDAVKKLDTDFLDESGMSLWGNAADDEEGRRSRVMRIASTDQQLIYLCAFYKICQQQFSSVHFNSAAERIRFFATCYNAGYRRNLASILRFQDRNDFYKYNYSAVSAYYFERLNVK